MNEHKRFEGRTVTVTGASRGMGKAIARAFAAEGAHLALNANEDAVYEVAREIKAAFGTPAVALRGDVSLKSDVDRFFALAVSEYGRLDVAVNNAGTITHAPITTLTVEEWDQVMNVNARGVFLCCQAAARQMLQQHYGKIINTASGAARKGFKYIPHYSASKFAVVGITQSLALELADQAITVNAFCPGIVDTDMWKHNASSWGRLHGYSNPDEFMQTMVRDMVPLGRVGVPEDVVGLVKFLASEEADYITGQTINVDGGIFMS